MSVYHIVHTDPSDTDHNILVEYEELAQALVHSGKMRIDTENNSNFIIFTDQKLLRSFTFSKQEMFEMHLLLETRLRLEKILAPQCKFDAIKIKLEVESTIQKLQDKFKYHIDDDRMLMIRLARIFVQSAHPIVIKWLLKDKVEVFISYANQIGDVMDVMTWKIAGTNSGMQSTNGVDVAIFVSCGGNPLAAKNEIYYGDGLTHGDGKPAIARMQIIAAQELGHYADIIKNSDGTQIDRHSANFNCTQIKPRIQFLRLKDIDNCHHIEKVLNAQCGLKKLISFEESLKFYKKHKIFNFKYILIYFFYIILKLQFIIRSHNHHMYFIKTIKNKAYLGSNIVMIIQDMIANLAPKADVYKSSNTETENAILCAEALARVPQQAIKWGHVTTKTFMHNLYDVYYAEVIPSLIESYTKLTKITYQRNYNFIRYGFLYKIKNFFYKT